MISPIPAAGRLVQSPLLRDFNHPLPASDGFNYKVYSRITPNALDEGGFLSRLSAAARTLGGLGLGPRPPITMIFRRTEPTQ